MCSTGRGGGGRAAICGNQFANGDRYHAREWVVRSAVLWHEAACRKNQEGFCPDNCPGSPKNGLERGRSGRIWTCDPCVPNVSSSRKDQQKQWSLLAIDHLYRRLFTGFRWSIGGRLYDRWTEGDPL